MTRSSLPALLAAAALLAAPAFAQSSSTVQVTNVNCSDGVAVNGHVAWPADDPVWEFDLTRPEASDSGTYPNGFGLEVSNVFYDGRKVFERANVPVLNVEYEPGDGCSCYRDWQDSEVGYAVEDDPNNPAPRVSTCFALAGAGEVTTTCELAEGGDAGSFEGISFEDYGDELVLTGHMRAGWYRYRIKWHFYSDGRIWPEYSYSAASATCTGAAHRHHAYWRFDFDLDGTPTDDVVREHNAAGDEVLFTTEQDRTWGRAEDGVYWSVTDDATGIGYEIVPGTEDLKLPIDAFSKTDALVLKYKTAELDDGITIGNGCAFIYDQLDWANDESIEDEDVVFWYRSSALHEAGNPWECDIVGPTLRPLGFAVSSGPPPMALGAVEVQAAAPNPTSGSTTVRFRVDAEQTVRAVLYDALGREVRVLFDGAVRAERYETLEVDAADLPTGTYVVRVDGERSSASTRIAIVR